MKKILSLSFLFMLILSSCNLPVAETAPPPTQISPKDMIATMVAATVTANPIAPATETQVVPPTMTDTPAVLTAAATATPALTATVTETSGPILSPSPTSNWDFASSLGQPTWKDTFVDSGGFFQKGTNSYEDDHTRIVIENGVMTLTSDGTPASWRGWRLANPSIKNFYLETTFVTHNCSGKDEYGMVFRAPNFDTGSGYYMAFSCDGNYRLFRNVVIGTDQNEDVMIFNWKKSDQILTGSGQTNRMGILVTGSTIGMYINGQKVDETSDSHFSDAGHFGPFISYVETQGFSVDLQNITYWIMP